MVAPLGVQGLCQEPGPAWPRCFHTADSGVPSSPFAGVDSTGQGGEVSAKVTQLNQAV